MKIVIVGHVDHGKSTLVGRLIHDTDSLPEGKLAQIKASCLKRGMPFEWSFLMDALQAERDQGITIDTTQIWFKTLLRNYLIIDAPGHKEFLKNMISGAAQSEAALLIIDAKEGVREQSKRHGYLLHLLGVRQIAVLVNKMDAVDYSEAVFRQIEQEYRAYLQEIGVQPTFIIPISARAGENITVKSSPLQWYKGVSVIEALDSFIPTPSLKELPLRFPVQDVYKFDERRIIAGRIESGTLGVGDEILFSPGNQKVKIASIETWNEPASPSSASAGQSVGITLHDQIFVERGQVASHVSDAPFLTNRFRARLFWLGHNPLVRHKRYKLKIGTTEIVAELAVIEKIVDTNDLAQRKAEQVENGSVAEVIFQLRGQVALDAFVDNPRTGRFVVLEGYEVCGGGIMDLEGFTNQRQSIKSTHITPVHSRITPQQRALLNHHQGGILWLTGLSGSGKSTLALELQRRLFAKGYQVTLLDGDTIRSGLNRDLGFSAEDRAENIRRISEVAKLFAEAGMIAIAAFISPTQETRDKARQIGGHYFHEIYVKADVETCKQRDPKGLYTKAIQGEIAEFTGISAPYEIPVQPDMEIDTASLDIDACVAKLLDYVQEKLVDVAQEQDYSIMGGI